MANRLSEESVLELYNKGRFSFSRFVENIPSEKMLSLDMDALLQRDDLAEVVPSIQPQRLYRSLLSKGPESCLEVLPHLSHDQFIRLFDYDVWQEDALSIKKALRWLQLYAHISPKQSFDRFQQLDEEYQIALLSPYIRCFTQEEYDQMPSEQQDLLCRFPGDAIYYSVNSADKEIAEGIEQLLSAGMENKMEYVLSLVCHASYMPPNESENLIAQFRRSRLEEDGFVSYEESLELIRSLSLSDYAARWRDKGRVAQPESSDIARSDKNGFFLDEVLACLGDVEEKERLQQGFVYLANSLCALTQIESDDMSGFKKLLEHSVGLSSLALEFLSEQDASRAAEILRAESPKTLFRIGRSMICQQQALVINALRESRYSFGKRIADNWRAGKIARTLRQFDQDFLMVLGFENIEFLKALFDLLPLGVQFETSEKTEALKVSFNVIRSLAQYSDLMTLTSRVIAQIRIANAAGFRLDVPWQTQGATLILRDVLERDLLASENLLKPSDLDEVCRLDDKEFQAKLEKGRGDLIKTLGHPLSVSDDLDQPILDGLSSNKRFLLGLENEILGQTQLLRKHYKVRDELSRMVLLSQ